MAESMAVQNGFTPVTVWVHYDHSSAVATRKFEYLNGEIFDKCCGPDVLPLTVEVGTDVVELQSGIREFFLKLHDVM